MSLCYACDPSNPDRIAAHDEGGSTLRFPSRFEGPPATVNGGMAAGALACPALAAAARDGIDGVVTRVSARLHRGVPHSHGLRADVERDGGAYRVTVRDGDGAVMSGAVEIVARGVLPGDVIAPVPDDLAAVVAEMAATGEPETPPFFEETGDHPVIGCFSCGPRNARGLHVYPRFAAHGVTWARWKPEPSFADPDGGLAPSIIAAALDCSSGVCLPREEQEELLRTDQFYLLGSIDVRYLRVAPPDAAYHVVGRARQRDGRKFFGLSVLLDAAGAPCALAEAVWIIMQARRSEVLGS